MRACDLFVFPSRYEPFGLVIVEALACGLPVITSQSAGIVGSLDDDACIRINKPDDAIALHAALQRLAADPALRAEMGARAGACALSLTWQTMAERYVAVFEDVLAQKRGG